MRLNIIIVVVLSLSTMISDVYSQAVTLTVYNPNVNFAINTFQKYEDGVSYVDWTTLGVTMTGANGSNFRVYYNTTSANIQAGASTLALNTLCVAATQNAASPLIAVSYNKEDLVQAPATKELVTNGTIDADPKSGKINISYWFGVDQTLTTCTCAPKQLMGNTPDLYSVDLTFTVEIF